MPRGVALLFCLLAALGCGAGARAQAVIPYGLPIGLDAAKRPWRRPRSEAKKITPMPYVIAIVDPGGHG